MSHSKCCPFFFFFFFFFYCIGQRIGKVVGLAMENDRMIQEYETLTSDLLRWIESTIESLNERDFANSLAGVQQQLLQFNNYRSVEKPPKFVEKGNLEVQSVFCFYLCFYLFIIYFFL